MDGGEPDEVTGARSEPPGTARARSIAPGQVWIACALCRQPVELSDSVATVEGHVCPKCADGL
jgi:hypothetical protein